MYEKRIRVRVHPCGCGRGCNRKRISMGKVANPPAFGLSERLIVSAGVRSLSAVSLVLCV